MLSHGSGLSPLQSFIVGPWVAPEPRRSAKEDDEMKETQQAVIIRFLMLALTVAIVFALHVGLGFLLYRGRVISGWMISESDLVVFILPIILAVIGYFVALRILPWFIAHPILNVMTSLLATFLSLWCCLAVSFTKYGT